MTKKFILKSPLVKPLKSPLSLLVFLVVAPLSQLWADETSPMIIEVRKKVKLHETERTYGDYFIRGGTAHGLSPGMKVSVIRRVPVHDSISNSSLGDFKVKVADLKIIQVDGEKAIGRLVEVDRREARPMIGYDAIMVGDHLDMTSIP